jgi:hypothetical protein
MLDINLKNSFEVQKFCGGKEMKKLLVVPLQVALLVRHVVQDSSKVGQSSRRKQAVP